LSGVCERMTETEQIQRSNLKPFTKENPGQRHTTKGPYLTPLIKKFLEKKITFEDPETQKKIKGKVKDAIIWRLLLNAAQGENEAIKICLDRMDGKEIQKLVGEGFGDSRIIIIRSQETKLENPTETIPRPIPIQR